MAGNDSYIVQQMIRNGAEINAQFVHFTNFTPLHFAIQGGQKEMVYTLLQNGASTNTRDDNRETPFEMALCLKKNDKVKIFMYSGPK